MSSVTGLVLGAAALLVVVGGVAARLRIRRHRHGGGEGPPEVTDETVRRIEEEGRLETEDREPLDHDRIRQEEDRFWSETWDRPDEPIL